MAVQQFPLGSTAIDTIWYDSATEDLWVKFRKVKFYPKYHFAGVPQEVVVELLNASSAGAVYHNRLKGNYYSTEIRGPENDGSLNIFQLDTAFRKGKEFRKAVVDAVDAIEDIEIL